MKPAPVILLAEDDEADAFLFQEAFENAHVGCVVKRVADGEQAIEYLKGSGCYANRAEFPFPTILVSDLKMPKMNGFEVIAWVRREIPEGLLPVVVLSGSNETRDTEQAAALGAVAYWVKSMDHQHLLGQIKELCEGLGCSGSGVTQGA